MKQSTNSVPVTVAAKVYGKDPSWVRAGLISGYLPIGFATRNGERITDVGEMNSRKGRINYYISPKLFYKDTGVLYGTDEFEEGLSYRNKELLYFCKQYPYWIEQLRSIESGSSIKTPEMIFPKSPGGKSDVTSAKAIARMYYRERIKMVQEAANSDDSVLEYVTGNFSIDDILFKYDVKREEFVTNLFRFFKRLGDRRQ